MIDFKKILDKKHTLENELSKCQSIDYETVNTKDYKKAVRPFDRYTKPFSFSIGHRDGNVEICRLDNKDKNLNAYNWNKLKTFWADTSIHKIAHNSSFEYAITSQAGITIPKETILHDTMIQSQMLRNLNVLHGLAHIGYELNDPEVYIYRGKTFNSKELDKFVHAEGRRLQGFDKIDIDLFNIYQTADGQRANLIHEVFYPELFKNERMLKDYYNELDVIRVTYYMMKQGLPIDREKCFELLEWLKGELKKLPFDIEQELGYFVNLGSDKQVAHILFRQLELPVIEFTEKGFPSTDKDTILALLDLRPDLKILKLILKHRSYTKGFANITSYLEFADENDIIHPNIKTNGAHKTGRQSCSDPNLQNAEKEKSMKNIFPVPARYCFVNHEDCVTILVDFDAIELRLILEAAQSIRMMENLKNGISPHVVFCKIVYGNHVPIEKRFISKVESPTIYDAGKNGHFCLCYGGALMKFAQTTLLTIDEASIGKNLYRQEFPEIVDLIKNGIDKIKNIGYVETAFGRILWIERDKLYAWLNFYIQGTAAGILKRAEVNVHNYLVDNWHQSGIALSMTIHDELLIKFPRAMLKYKNQVLTNVSNIMTYMPEIKVDLKVTFKQTNLSWAEAKPILIGN